MKITHLLLLILFSLLACGCDHAPEQPGNSNPEAQIPEDGSEPTLVDEGP